MTVANNHDRKMSGDEVMASNSDNLKTTRFLETEQFFLLDKLIACGTIEVNV